jgi:DNA-binding NtrC family response regulator
MFSDMLFGHRAGAFTGATASLSGLVERAAHGTLFLDEIGDLAHGSQVKLLRLLESGEFYPVGSDVHRRAETRVVVATNTDIEEAVRNGRFRRDLYYRLRTHHIEVPPLRSRPGDIPVLVRHFAEEAAMELGRKPPTVPDAVNALLGSYPFPGNVRELRSLVFDAVGSRESSSLPLELFRPVLGKPQDLTGAGNAQHADGAGLLTIRQTVDRLVEQALEIAHGNRLAAARILGITPQALGQRMKRSRSA